MAIRHGMVIAAAFAALVQPAPMAQAAPAQIQFRFSTGNTDPSGGDANVTRVVCHGIATPETPEPPKPPGPVWIPLAIEVRCVVGSLASKTSVWPGAYGATHIVLAAPAPITICAYGEALFIKQEPEGGRNGDVVSVTGEACTFLPG